MPNKTILFFPIEIGIAHITRSLAIAEELQKLGHHCIIAIPKQKQKLIADKTSVKIIDISPCSREDSINVLNDLRDVKFLLKLAREEIKIISQIKPNLIVVDYRLSAVASSLTTKTPLAMITSTAGLPARFILPNLGLPPVIQNLLQPLLSRLILKVKKQFLKNLDQVIATLGSKPSLEKSFKNILFISPQGPNYLPPINTNLNIAYTGPIFWSGFDKNKTPTWLKKIKPDGNTIYLTFGGTGFSVEQLVKITIALLSAGYRVIVSYSNIAKPSDFPKHPNLFISQYLPGGQVSQQVDLVVCHGGFGTMSQAIAARIPIIALPFNPDQINHSLRFQELGLGKTIFNFDIPGIVAISQKKWQEFEKSATKAHPNQVVKKVQDIFANYQKYQKNITEYLSQQPKQKGASIAAKKITAHLRSSSPTYSNTLAS